MKNKKTLIGLVLLATISTSFYVWKQIRSSQKAEQFVGFTNEKNTPAEPDLILKSTISEDEQSGSTAKNAKAILPVEELLKPVVFRSDPFKNTPAERLVSIKNAIELKYSKTIKAMKLTPEVEQQLRNLLILRYEVAYMAHEIVVDGQQRKPHDLADAIDAAQADVDIDIQKIFPAEIAKQVKQMIMAGDYLLEVNTKYDRAMTALGESITPEQTLPLASALLEAYGIDNPNAVPHNETINPKTGLTPLDEIVLRRAASILSPRQKEILRNLIETHNRQVLNNNS